MSTELKPVMSMFVTVADWQKAMIGWQRDRIADIERQNAELVRQLAEAKKDTERYRVLRDPAYQMQEDDPCVTDDCFNTFFEEDLDKAVDALKERHDAAMQKEPTK